MNLKRAFFIALAFVLGWFIPSQALACGMPLAARIPAEQSLIQFVKGREEIVSSVQLQVDRPGTAVIVGVPGVPEVSALANNESLTEDFVIGQAASDALYRMVTTRKVYIAREPGPTSGDTANGRSIAGPIIGIALAFIVSTIALGLALGVRKRINAIARPEPKDEQDDELLATAISIRDFGRRAKDE